jgi:HEAT repeat protein
LLYAGDPAKRRKAVELLVEVQDKNMINPLLAHLRREDVFEIKNLLIEGIGHSGKKRAILAIMDTLKEIGDRELRLRAIEFFYALLDGNLKSILTEIRESEEDPVIATKIDGLLSTIKET